MKIYKSKIYRCKDKVWRLCLAHILSNSNNEDCGGQGTLTGDMFNGNIKSITEYNAWTANVNNNIPFERKHNLNAYTYDQLNRIKTATNFADVSTIASSNGYREQFSYDANGNILTLNRYGTSALSAMDSLKYYYYLYNTSTQAKSIYVPGTTLGSNEIRTNQLAYVEELQTSSGNYPEDIEDQTLDTNYKYDEIGNLIKDYSANMDIYWTLSGKVDRITMPDKNQTIYFTYDPMGNRVSKRIEYTAGEGLDHITTTHYVKDAQGNTLATYLDEEKFCSNLSTRKLKWLEQDLFGSSRLGMYHAKREIFHERSLSSSTISDTSCESDIDKYTVFKHYDATRHCITIENPYHNPAKYTLCEGEEMYDKYRLQFGNQISGGNATLGGLPAILDQYVNGCIYLKGLNGSAFNNALQICVGDADYDVAYNYYVRNNYHVNKGVVEYEITNHLGNVMATYTDRKRAVINSSSSVVDYYYPELSTSYNYYAFGSFMPDRAKFAIHCQSVKQALDSMVVDSSFTYNQDFNTSTIWSPYGTSATTTADASNSQMIVDYIVPGEGTAATVPIVQNKLNNVTVDLTNVSYSLGVLVEIYESGTSTLITSSGPYNPSSPQHIVFPIDFTIRPTVTNVDIRIIGGPGTTSPSAPPENFTVQSITCYTYDTTILYRDSVVAVCDNDMWYRYGFNGHEKDDEIKGSGNHLSFNDYGYDPRTGRRWRVDPHFSNYPSISGYSAFANNPIINLDPDGKDIVYFNAAGLESHRVQSKTEFKTFIMANGNAGNPKLSVANWKEVAMPKIIEERTQSGETTTGTEYQENDYVIAARTGYFNQSKNSGQLKLYTEGGNAIPNDAVQAIPDLDPTLVKSVAMQESHIGTTGVTDILQANAPGDWSVMKGKYSLTKGESPNVTNSLYSGLRILATKGFKGGITYDKKTGVSSYTFQGWNKAVGSYNGGGTKGYQDNVTKQADNATTPDCTDYTDECK